MEIIILKQTKQAPEKKVIYISGSYGKQAKSLGKGFPNCWLYVSM